LRLVLGRHGSRKRQVCAWRRARPRRRCLGPAETRPSAAELLEDPFFARRHAGAGDARKDRAGIANGGEPSGLADERSLREHADVANEGEACEARARVGFVGWGGFQGRRDHAGVGKEGEACEARRPWVARVRQGGLRVGGRAGVGSEGEACEARTWVGCGSRWVKGWRSRQRRQRPRGPETCPAGCGVAGQQGAQQPDCIQRQSNSQPCVCGCHAEQQWVVAARKWARGVEDAGKCAAVEALTFACEQRPVRRASSGHAARCLLLCRATLRGASGCARRAHLAAPLARLTRAQAGMVRADNKQVCEFWRARGRGRHVPRLTGGAPCARRRARRGQVTNCFADFGARARGRGRRGAPAHRRRPPRARRRARCGGRTTISTSRGACARASCTSGCTWSTRATSRRRTRRAIAPSTLCARPARARARLPACTVRDGCGSSGCARGARRCRRGRVGAPPSRPRLQHVRAPSCCSAHANTACSCMPTEVLITRCMATTGSPSDGAARQSTRTLGQRLTGYRVGPNLPYPIPQWLIGRRGGGVQVRPGRRHAGQHCARDRRRVRPVVHRPRHLRRRAQGVAGQGAAGRQRLTRAARAAAPGPSPRT
jgi:hypothetical protein